MPQKWKPGQHIHLMFFLLFLFYHFLWTELEKQLSDKCLNFNVTYKHFMHRSETISHVGQGEKERGSEHEQGALNAKLFTIVKLRARLWVHAHTRTATLTLTHSCMDKKLEKNLIICMLWLVIGLSVIAVLSLSLSPFTLSCIESAPQQAAAKCKSACGVCAAKYATHFNRNGLHTMWDLFTTIFTPSFFCIL